MLLTSSESNGCDWCCSATVSANRLYLENYQRVSPAVLAGKSDNGPTIIDPVFVHPTARVHPTAVLGPNVTIDEGCVVGEGVRIRESIVLPGVKLRDNACVIDAIVGWNSTVGSWARVEGSPVGSAFEDEQLTVNGVKKPSVTILSTHTCSHALITHSRLGGDIHVADERCIRNCIVLPHKDLTSNYHNEIVM